MLSRLDEFTLSKLTKFAHWFQRMTGRTNYFLAKMGVLIILASITLTIVSYVAPTVPQEDRPSLIIVFLFGIFGIGEVCRMTELDKAERDFLNSTSSNPAKWSFPKEPTHRVFWIFACGITVLMSITYPRPTTIWTLGRDLFPFGVVLFRYFVDVNPLPPGKSKVKEFFEAVAAYLSPAKTAGSEAQR